MKPVQWITVPTEKKPFQVLVIEDEPEAARSITASLQAAGPYQFEVTLFEHVSEACELLNEKEYDFVLLDLTIPEEWGLDSLIRISARAPQTPIIIIATEDDQALATSALDAGAADYFIKSPEIDPTLPERLISVLQRTRFHEVIQRRSGLDPLTGLETRNGFIATAGRHLELARHAGKDLLLVHCRIATSAEAESDERMISDAAPVIRDAFRGSDIVGILGSGAFGAIAIVNPSDNSRDVLEMRLQEHLAAHQARTRSTQPLPLSYTIHRFTPEPNSTIEEVLGILEG